MELGDRTVMLLGGSGPDGRGVTWAGRSKQGRPTGKDVIAALDASTAGPTYRAGMLRRNVVGRLRSLEEREGKRGVAYEMLGPPRLTKMLYAIEPEDPIEPSRFATWVFTVEEKGARIKR